MWDGDPLNCTKRQFRREWKGPKARRSAGSDDPVNFPLPRNQNVAYLNKQIEETRIMFDGIVSDTEEFKTYAMRKLWQECYW